MCACVQCPGDQKKAFEVELKVIVEKMEAILHKEHYKDRENKNR